MTHVTIVTGSSGAGKTKKLLEHYRAALDRARTERRPGTTLWLTPNQRVQKSITQQVVNQCGFACFAPNVLTFDLFARKVLEVSGSPASPISAVMKRLLLRRIAAALHIEGELRYFQPIAGTTGFLDLISSFIRGNLAEHVCRSLSTAFVGLRPTGPRNRPDLQPLSAAPHRTELV